MKIRRLLSVGYLTAILAAGSCSNDYDERFDKLEQELQDVISQVEGASELSTAIAALESEINTLKNAVSELPDGDALSGGLSSLEEQLGVLKTELNLLAQIAVTSDELAILDQNSATSSELGALSDELASLAGDLVALVEQSASSEELSDLANELAQLAEDGATSEELAVFVEGFTSELNLVKSDLAELLENSNVLTGDLVIFDTASLMAAIALGNRVAIITGNVEIRVNELSITELEKVTSKLQVAMKNVEIQTTKSFDLSNLESVGNDYKVYGHSVEDSGLDAVGGLMELSYPGDYDYPNLKVVGVEIRLGIEEDEQLTSINVADTESVVVNFPLAVSNGVKTFKGLGLKPSPDANFTSNLAFENASLVVFGNVPVGYLSAPKAITVTLGFNGEIKDIDRAVVYAPMADQVTFDAEKVDGELIIITAEVDDDFGTWSYFGLSELFKNPELAKLPENWSSNVSLSNLDFVESDILLASSALSLPKLVKVGEEQELFLTQSQIQLPELVVAGDLQLYVPLSVTFASVDLDRLNFMDDSVLTSISLEQQELNVSPDLLSTLYTFDALKSFSIIGDEDKEGPLDVQVRPAGPRDMFPLLESVSLGGKIETARVGPTKKAYDNGGRRLPGMKEVNTSGFINDLIIRNMDELQTVALDHDFIPGGDGAELTVVNNDKLETLSTGKLDFVRKLWVRKNAELSEMDFSSLKSLVLNFTDGGGNKQLDYIIDENKLVGEQTPAVAQTGTTDGTPYSISSPDLYSLKPMMDAIAAYGVANDLEFQQLIKEVTINLWIDSTDNTTTDDEEKEVVKIQSFPNHPYLYTWSDTNGVIIGSPKQTN